jgi:hypothetical protein
MLAPMPTLDATGEALSSTTPELEALCSAYQGAQRAKSAVEANAARLCEKARSLHAKWKESEAKATEAQARVVEEEKLQQIQRKRNKKTRRRARKTWDAISAQRGADDRQLVQSAAEPDSESEAEAKAEALARSFLAEVESERDAENAAATKLQARWARERRALLYAPQEGVYVGMDGNDRPATFIQGSALHKSSLTIAVEQDEESAQASATTLQAVWRGRRSRQRPNYLCTDHRERAEEKGREDVYENGRLARSRWPSGRIDIFRGDDRSSRLGEDRLAWSRWPSGRIDLFRGDAGQERRYRTVWASGHIEHYIPSETNRFDGKRVYAEWPNGRIDWFGAQENNGACICIMHADGCRDHYRGDAGKEVRTHRDMPDGHVQIFAMDGDRLYLKEERWPSGMRRVFRSMPCTETFDPEWRQTHWKPWKPAEKAKCLEDAQKEMEAAWAPSAVERWQLRYGGAYERDAKKRTALVGQSRLHRLELVAREQAATAEKAKKERRRARATSEADAAKKRAAEEAAQKAQLDEEHAAKVRAAQARADARQRAREQAAIAKKAKKERRRSRAAVDKVEADREAEAMQAARAAVEVLRAAVRQRQAMQAARAAREARLVVRERQAQREREEEERARRAEVAEAQQRAWDLIKRQAEAASAAAAFKPRRGARGGGGRGGRGTGRAKFRQPEAPAKASAECVVCLDAEATHVVVPCGHICLCADCTMDLKACPLCRTPLVQTMRIYLVNN